MGNAVSTGLGDNWDRREPGILLLAQGGCG